MYYTRNYADVLRNLSKYFPVITLSGARQTGKTTLLRDVFNNYNYVSLDLPSTAAQAEKNPADFFAQYQAPLIIDEVQYAPNIFRHLKSLIDTDRHAMGRYILTGSQKFNLMREVSDSLAGRAAILDLENLSWDEIHKNTGKQLSYASLIHFISRGQFPELWRVSDLPFSPFYSSYIATYLERDVRQILNVTSLRDFERFIRSLAPRSGQLLNKTELARDVGVSVKAINDWLSVLQASNQIVLLEPWFKNISRRMIKSPKVYFCDSGLLCFLLGVNEHNFMNSPFKGQIWETVAYSEMRKLNQTSPEPVNFWFYRDQTAREIDFVIEKGGYLSFLECRWTANPGKDDVKTIQSIDRELLEKEPTYKPGHHFLLCTAEAPYTMYEKISVTGLAHVKDII